MKINIRDALVYIRTYLLQEKNKVASKEAGISKQAGMQMSRICREVMSQFIMWKMNTYKLGSNGGIVELDESLFLYIFANKRLL